MLKRITFEKVRTVASVLSVLIQLVGMYLLMHYRLR